MAIGEDGTVLIASGAAPIRRIAPDGKLVPVVSLDTAAGESSHDAPFFLPDGKHFLFIGVHRDVAKGALKRILKAASLDSSDVVTIGEVSSRAEYAKGYLFSVRESSLIAEPFDVKKLKVTGDPIVICDDVSFNSRTGAASFATSPDGMIAVQSPAFGIRATWVDDKGVIHGTVGKPVTTNRGIAVVHNPDRIVMSVPDLKLGNTYLWVFDVGRETGTRLTYGSAMEISPAVTPDGNRVYFSSDVEPGMHVYEAPIDGSVPPKLVIRAANTQQPMEVSPDGRFLLYQSNENQAVSRQDLWALPLTEGAKPYPVVATPAVEGSGVFSPDGRWIAYVSDVSGLPQVYLKPFAGPGAARLVSANGGGAPRFTPDGKHLLFADDAKVMSAAVAPNGVTGEPQLLFTAPERVLSIQIIGDRYLLQLQNDADASPPMRIITDWQPSSR